MHYPLFTITMHKSDNAYQIGGQCFVTMSHYILDWANITSSLYNIENNIYGQFLILMMSKLFGQKLFLKKILYIYSLQQTDALDSLAFTERKFCAIDALVNFDYKPLFMFQVNLGSDLFFSEGTV